MKHQAVIFDLDGTLTDSAPGILEGARVALRAMGREIPDEPTLRKFLGPTLMHSFTTLTRMSEADAARAQDIYRDFYIEQGHIMNAVYPGIRALLKALKDAGYFLGVATHKPLPPSLTILESFDLLRYFDKVAGPAYGEDPDPDKAELIRRANPDNLPAIMVGDRASDLVGANKAGAGFVAALYGYGHREEFEALGGTKFAHSVEELYPLLGLEKPAKKGVFISFEGNDGSGKSTHTRLLAGKLRQLGHEVLLTREPGGTAVGEKIRDILLDRANNEMDNMTEALLYAAARAQHTRQVILPALEAGKLVISDRYVDSSLAYQGAGRGLGVEAVRQINRAATGGLLPDLTVFLSLSPKEGIDRAARKREMDRLEAAGDAFHQRVAEAFREMIQTEPRFLEISSLGSKQETAELVFKQVSARLRELGLP